jgi:hypothetical protein
MIRKILFSSLTMAALLASASGFAADAHKSSSFAGVKANTGYVTHTMVEGKDVLTLSDDFIVPQTPDPHWQVVDSSGNTYLLQRLPIQGEKVNRQITVPAYVKDIAKVQIWCAFAEANLGEAVFDHPVPMVRARSFSMGGKPRA